MKFEFKESKYPIFSIVFWILIIFSLYSIIFSFVNNKFSFGSEKYFGYPLNPIKINAEFKVQAPQNFMVCFEDYCTNLAQDNFSKIHSETFNFENEVFFEKPIKNIRFIYPIDFNLNYLRIIDLHVGDDNYYYTQEDISKFEKKEIKINLENNKEEKFNSIKLPQVNNYRGVLKHIAIDILALFYSWQAFIVPYFWLFVASLIYVFKKDKIKLPKTKEVFWIFGLLFLALVLRVSFLNNHPLWIDEVHTKIVAIKDFKSCFSDAGNPPMFYILELAFSKIFSNSDIALRTFSLLCSIGAFGFVYLIFKNISKTLALFSIFFFAINAINIYHSVEARSYSFDFFLGVSIIYFLFEYLKNKKIKNLICYSIFSILAINSHYMLTIFVLGNIFWGLFSLIDEKNKKEIVKFLSCNFVCGVTFLPYLLISFKSAVNSDFNGWIGQFSGLTFKYIILEYFSNKYVFVFFCLIILSLLIFSYLPKKIISKLNLKINFEKEKLFIYLVYSILFVLLFASIISVAIKPMLHKRVLLAVYFLLFLLEIVSIATIFNFENLAKKFLVFKKVYAIGLILLFLTITKPMLLNNILRYDAFMDFLAHEVEQFKDSGYEIIAITNLLPEYLKNYPQVSKLNVNWKYVDTNSGYYLKKLNKGKWTNNKKVIIYTHNLVLETKGLAFNPLASVYSTNSIANIRVIYSY